VACPQILKTGSSSMRIMRPVICCSSIFMREWTLATITSSFSSTESGQSSAPVSRMSASVPRRRRIPTFSWTRAISSHWASSRATSPWAEDATGLVDQRQVESNLPPEKLFDRVRRLGGTTGWYYANWIWELRGAVDRLLGGVGMRRGRRDPERLWVGDALDFWRVERFEEGRLLTLRAEMKLPGQARLSLAVRPGSAGGSVLTQQAEFQPHGILGHLYWLALLPVHAVIFRGMARRIARPAESERG
jgi:hypothetical protein